MAGYDPKRNRRPGRPIDGEAPVDQLLDATVGAEPPRPSTPARVEPGRPTAMPPHIEVSEPTAVPVVPDIGEADPDLRFKIGVMGGVAATIALIGLWLRRRTRRSDPL